MAVRPLARSIQISGRDRTRWETVLHLGSGYGGDTSELLTPERQVVYLVLFGNLAAGAGRQEASIFRARPGSSTWQQLRDPCSESRAGFVTVALAAARRGYVAAVCEPRAESGAMFLLTSHDFGHSSGRSEVAAEF